MAGFFARLFGGDSRAVAQARSAEARGDLARAAALYTQASRPDEAARIMLMRGDAEIDAAARLRHFVQAVATAPEGTPERERALQKRALLVLALGLETARAVRREDLLEVGADLESLGDHARAAEAYALAKDVDGQVRALARAGHVDRLDTLLVEQQDRDRLALARHRAHREVDTLVATGLRREAASLARSSDDETLRERGRAIDAKRLGGSVVRVTLRGKALVLVLGERVVLGRGSESGDEDPGAGVVAIPSAAVSRRHVALARRGDDVVVRELGSRNGTTVRGLALAQSGEVLVGGGLELRLGGEVPATLRPATDLPGAVALDVSGVRYVLPLGPASLGIGAWRLERGDDDWIELHTGEAPPAYEGVLCLAPRVTLLVGDAIAKERDAPAVLVV